MRIGIIVAMEKELCRLRALLEGERTEKIGGREFYLGTVGGNEIIIERCGIGKVNSAVGATEMIDKFSPRLVVSTGVAGGASADLNITEVVVARECVYHDAYCGKECAFGQVMGMPERYVAPAEFVEKALSLNDLQTGLPEIHAGLTVSGDWFVDSKEKMNSILDRFPEAMAVDMESCSIAQVCHIYGVPFVSFRIISDIPLKDVDAAMYFNFWERLAKGSFGVTKSFLERL
ncbi:MAG: 5'-methylthioadenosine/adenosylhomocysteine nucleosidase [Prevotella sp.]|uniref:5'-methylthioadenosine/adenosylhomocysteine nucleosidase n=1 Tax=Prevotella sp. TaxID=59823 RepID=UPI002A2BEF22|nr:5'-methylthioadenosine/adenosylhomocysteine nucleosidase [Prevotella sp.]MDD7317380.1 5'-methylthioadenosine/adenosylhomocysteine nucleosidase [Prevotellaceae bacterium]MDY4019478.1 5'-methylthioadenosine/adenosylhomocysteine nucleosidase [Prevotella sp.]